ncbi:MAG TPA: DUF222 domain-containing protein [Actinomycetes bacterium]|nr:DUF222 domain-containing protein [Actinomycetes bacterium]
MDSNTHSVSQPPGQSTGEAAGRSAGASAGAPGGRRDRLAALAAEVEALAAQDLGGLTDVALAEEVLELRRLLDRLEGQWLRRVAAVDARGAAGADQDQQVGSTAAWLRTRLRLGAGSAASSVRTARAVFRGPLPTTAAALTSGELSPTHAAMIAAGTHQLPDHLTADADPILVEAARRLNPPQLRRVLSHLRLVADPDGEDDRSHQRHARRGVWLAPTWEGMVAIDGLLEAEAGQTLLAALEPLARPADAGDTRSGSQRNADALGELARRALEGGRLPQTGGVRPQLSVIVDLDSLVGGPGGLGGDIGGMGPLAPEACRRLACDGAVTRVLVTRQHHPDGRPGGQDGRTGAAEDQDHPGYGSGSGPCAAAGPVAHDPNGQGPPLAQHPTPTSSRTQELQRRLRAAMALLPPILGGAPAQPLDVGRTSRVVQPAQRTALAVRDGGCVFPDCARPLTWCEAHHLVHWLDGGPTDLANLILVCRAHHRAVHEGGWRLIRGPDGHLTASPPHRRHPAARRHPSTAA